MTFKEYYFAQTDHNMSMRYSPETKRGRKSDHAA